MFVDPFSAQPADPESPNLTTAWTADTSRPMAGGVTGRIHVEDPTAANSPHAAGSLSLAALRRVED